MIKISFLYYLHFNIIFGLCGIWLIVCSIILIIRLGFNPLDFILIAIGIIMLLIMILGLNIKKRYELCAIYLIFIIIHIILYLFLSIMLLFLTDKLITFLENKLSIDDGDLYLNYIEESNVIFFIISGSLSLLCLMLFISLVNYLKGKLFIKFFDLVMNYIILYNYYITTYKHYLFYSVLKELSSGME